MINLTSTGFEGLDRAPAEENLNGSGTLSAAVAPLPATDVSRTKLLHRLSDWVTRFQEFGNALPASEVVRHSLVWSLMHEGTALVASALDAGIADDDVRNAIVPVRAIQRSSPFVCRLQDWPRGYPGDFESIEYICRQQNRADPGTLAWYIEAVTLNTPIAQQHRNKVSRQAALLTELVTRKPDSSILIVACGGGTDVRQALPVLERSSCRLVLNDLDGDALAYCREGLAPLGERVQYVQGNVFRSFRRLADCGPFDLILCGGLFDYLTERQITLLLQRLRDRLCDGPVGAGRLFFTNIGVGNPYRPWMEYFADWRLIERTPAELRSMLKEAGFPASCVSVVSDPTGLAWLVEATLP